MNRTPAYRGQPLVALILILGGWIAVRMMIWDAWRATAPSGAKARLAVEPAKRVSPLVARRMSRIAAESAASPDEILPPVSSALSGPPPAPPPLARPRVPRSLAPRTSVPVPAQISAADQLLWMDALEQLPLPAGLTVHSLAPFAAVPAVTASPHRARRWSADAWLLLRRGGNAPHTGGFSPSTYGASQVGAVVRYRLAPGSAHRPSLYMRGSAALNGSREREVALGLSVRPLAGVPVVVAGEGRVNSQPTGTHLRPAVLAYTEVAPIALPLRTRAEFYAQGGYVGGNFASAFADGQLRVDRSLVRLGPGELRAGAGAWGGAQRGASRLDLGPSATLGLPIGGSASARLAVDWRFRVAGEAEPGSGPALTLSAGF